MSAVQAMTAIAVCLWCLMRSIYIVSDLWVLSECGAPVQGAAVSASDISDAMAAEARSRYQAALAQHPNGSTTKSTFEGSDLESLRGTWDIVTCLDVLIHYDQVWQGALVFPLSCPVSLLLAL